MTTTLSQWEVGPFNEGMNIAVAATEIDENQGSIVQDFLLDKPGLIYTRGTVGNVGQTSATFNGVAKNIKGLFSTNAPDGATHLASVTQDTAATNLNFTVLTDTGNAPGITIVLDAAFPIASDCIVDAKPALGGGLWIGTQELNATPNVAGRQCLFHWRGGTKANYSTGTCASVAGSPVITGTSTVWTTNLVPGMFLIDSIGTVVGVVKSIQSNTSLTLEFPANTAGSGSISGAFFSSLRGWNLEVSKGRISTTSGQTGVIGSGTKFLSTPFDASPHIYPIYRARDNVWIGSTSTVQGDEGLTLAATATQSMDNELYVSRPVGYSNKTAGGLTPFQIPVLSDGTTNDAKAYPGIFNTTYAGLQWFARNDGPTWVGTGEMHSRVWFTDYRNSSSIDLLSQDGDFLQVASTIGQNKPITGVSATTNALLIFKENETFAITGDSPDTFALNKIWDDGCLCSMSIVQYRGAVMWAGRRGIYLFDGKTVTNIVAASLGPAYTAYMVGFDTRLHRMSAGTYNDHYFVSVNPGYFPNVPYTYSKNGGVMSALPQANCISVYIPTHALSFFTNPNISGVAAIPGTTLYATAKTYVCDFAGLFSFGGTKDFPASASSPYYPDPVFQTKWYSMKDPLLKKMFKQVLGTFRNDTGGLPIWVDVVPGLGADGLVTPTTLTAQFQTSTNPFAARLKFLKRDRYVRLKFYQDTEGVHVGGRYSIIKLAIGYKPQKIGRL